MIERTNIIDFGRYRIVTITTGKPWQAHAYLVVFQPTGDQVLLDPGDEAQELIKIVLEYGAKLRLVMLTHGHHDHIGAAAEVCRHFDIPCRLHMADVRLLRHAPMYALRFAGKKIQAPEDYLLLDGGDTFEIGEETLRVIHTPGHSPGSVCYHLGGVLFTGDTLFRERVGRTDLPRADSTQLHQSVDRILMEVSHDTIILPGHGRRWTIGQAVAWWRETAVSPPAFDRFE